MKGVRFYLEFPDKETKRKATVKNPEGHLGNVVAICLDDDDHFLYHVENGLVILEGFSAVYFQPNSPVNYGGVGQIYLHDMCKRIPEKLAQEIHPELFKRLDT